MGLDKLSSTKDVVATLQEELTVLQPQLVKTMKEVCLSLTGQVKMRARRPVLVFRASSFEFKATFRLARICFVLASSSSTRFRTRKKGDASGWSIQVWLTWSRATHGKLYECLGEVSCCAFSTQYPVSETLHRTGTFESAGIVRFVDLLLPMVHSRAPACSLL